MADNETIETKISDKNRNPRFWYEMQKYGTKYKNRWWQIKSFHIFIIHFIFIPISKKFVKTTFNPYLLFFVLLFF